jgi:cell division protein FtsB
MTLEELKAENARLKAEVEELKSQPDPLTAYLYAAELGKDNIKRLKAEVERLTKQVERLTKAGDVMANRLMYQGYHLTIPQWNEAKDLYPRD